MEQTRAEKQFLNDQRAGKIQSDIAKNINLLVVGKLEAKQLHTVLANAGIVNPDATVAHILARRTGAK